MMVLENSQKHKFQKGFTLLEVLISFVILSSVLGIIYQLLSVGTIRTKQAEKETYAALMAKSLMVGAADKIIPAQGIENGFSWEIEIQKKPKNRQSITQLAAVTVRIKWQGFRGERLYEIKTLKLLPKIN